MISGEVLFTNSLKSPLCVEDTESHLIRLLEGCAVYQVLRMEDRAGSDTEIRGFDLVLRVAFKPRVCTSRWPCGHPQGPSRACPFAIPPCSSGRRVCLGCEHAGYSQGQLRLLDSDSTQES